MVCDGGEVAAGAVDLDAPVGEAVALDAVNAVQ
jgi:hypothetical protein